MSTAFAPESTRRNHPDWVVNPVVDWERTTERRKQRRFLRHWKERGSGSLDRSTPEPFTWVKERQKRNPNVTTQRINQARFEDSVARENAKISQKIKQLRAVRCLWRPYSNCSSYGLSQYGSLSADCSHSWATRPRRPSATNPWAR